MTESEFVEILRFLSDSVFFMQHSVSYPMAAYIS